MKKQVKKFKFSRKHYIVGTIALIVGIAGVFFVYQTLQKPFRIDFSSVHDTKAEAHYTPRAEKILNLENKRLGKLFSALGASTAEKPDVRCYFTNDPAGHERGHGCEVSQTGLIPLGSLPEKQHFYDAAKKLSDTLEAQKWQTDGADSFDTEKNIWLKILPFASFVTTQPLPVTHLGNATSWPLLRYSKTSYYQEIDHEASCSINLIVDQTIQPTSLRLGLDCAFHFDE